MGEASSTRRDALLKAFENGEILDWAELMLAGH